MAHRELLKKNQISTQLALAGLISLATVGISACHSSTSNIIKCTGVATTHNQSLYIDKGVCKKLAGGKPVPINCQQWSAPKNGFISCEDAGSHIKAPHYVDKDYIKCYGVAAAGMNDCGTLKTACGGTIHVAKEKDAWIAIPNGLCRQIKGAIPKELK